MRFLRPIFGCIGAPFRWRQRRLLLAGVLLVASVALLTVGLTGLLLAKESEPAVVYRGTLDVPVNGLDTPTATPIPTPPPSSAPVVRMIIEKISVDAPVITMGLDEEHVPRVPDNPDDVVWYDFSTPPGWGSNAVFSGHVDWTVNGVPVTGVFYDLRKVEVGDIIKVRLADNTEYQYKVTGNVAMPYDDPKAMEVMGATPTEMLTIITCGGTWVPQWGNPIGGNYTHRQIVRAERIYQESTGYEIVEREDVSFGQVVRLQFRVRVTGQPTEADLQRISQDIVDKEKEAQPVNAISLFFYLPDTDTHGPSTAGKADWAPDGSWAKADEVEAGDYSRHQLVVEVSGPLPTSTPSDAAAEIPEPTRRQIFYDLVAARDSGVGDERAYEGTAQKYQVPIDTVRKIAAEGVAKDWPMP